MTEKIKLEASWKAHLADEFHQDYMIKLRAFLAQEMKKGKIIFPPPKDIFNAFDFTPFDEVKVVIIGQDPYHGTGEAHGLCFSVRPGVKVPPSLKNIFNELGHDLKLPVPNHGCLEFWARQGVLLLNTVLTVEKDKPASHRGQGWEIFTDKVVEELNQKKEGLVFLLWGRDARTKGAKIDREKHLVLESAHPSPFSVTNFYHQHHFSRANQYLMERGELPINWGLPTLKTSNRVTMAREESLSP